MKMKGLRILRRSLAAVFAWGELAYVHVKKTTSARNTTLTFSHQLGNNHELPMLNSMVYTIRYNTQSTTSYYSLFEQIFFFCINSDFFLSFLTSEGLMSLPKLFHACLLSFALKHESQKPACREDADQ